MSGKPRNNEDGLADWESEGGTLRVVVKPKLMASERGWLSRRWIKVRRNLRAAASKATA
jgi:hypothetical protein